MLETGVLAQSERFREVSQGPKSVRGSVISWVLSGFAMGKAALRTGVFCKTFGRPQTESAEEVACTGEGVVAWLKYLKTYCCILLKSSGLSSRFSRFWRECSGLRTTESLQNTPVRNAAFPIAKPLKTHEITDPLTLFGPCETSLKRSDCAKTPVSSTNLFA